MRILKFWPSAQPAPQLADAPVGLDAFPLESSVGHEAAARPKPAAASRPSVVRPTKWIGVLLLGAAAAGAGFGIFKLVRSQRPPLATFTLETTEPGAEVFLDGRLAGRTPLTVRLAAGSYDAELRMGTVRRKLAVKLPAGGLVTQQVELAPPAAPRTATGSLDVQTEPSRLAVSVDDVEKGLSPLSLAGLAPGQHRVSIRAGQTVLRRVVMVREAETTSLVVTAAASDAPAAGWLVIASKVALQLRENGHVIGTSESDRIMLPAGVHNIEAANEALGYRTQRRVEVTTGKTTKLSLELPAGMINVNAVPWADVWIDGEKVGQTPIGNISRTIGSHQIVLRHPELGERTETVTVAVDRPARLGVDLRKK